ncbi:MAG: hypothetical protein FWE70_08785, partial [Oscillospiraceae bacterium]|nr:hypothetical protein [Oscillospiraceae bacterium]
AAIAEADDGGRRDRMARHIERNYGSLFLNGYNQEGGVLMSPSFSFYAFEGLHRLGLHALAERYVAQGWGWMLSHGKVTCPEYFSHASSQCHAWSATPTYFLSREVGGVRFPVDGDPDVVEVRVGCSDAIEWAEVSWPHPRGLISVRWHMEGEGPARRRVFDVAEAPAGVTLTVTNP